MNCTVCQAELAAGTRVCGSCGHPVSINPTLEDLYFSRLIAAAPQKFVQKVRSAPYLAKERRMVTALLLTIANNEDFTSAVPDAERMSLLNQALDLIANVIFQYEGSLAKLWENTVLVFFGAPVSHEDDPLRAVYAAHAIRTEIQNFSEQIKEEFGVPLQLHMVLNTGPILIGEIKSNLKYSFQSLGSTLECMDSATRFSIPRCEIIVFEDTYQSVKPFIEVTLLDSIPCPTLNTELRLWRIDEVTHPERSLHRTPVNQTTALVCRKKELELLLGLGETVLAGLGRVALITGEAGIGKSRLILEWKRSLKTLRQPTRIRWIEAHSQAFGRELAYHLLKSLVRAALGVTETEPKDQTEQILEETLTDLLGVDETKIYPFLAHLLDLPLSAELEGKIHQLSAQDLHAHYLDSITQFLKALALEQPVIIILEDLHWGDGSSIDLLGDLLSITTMSPVLICLVTRPDRDSEGWQLVMAARERINTRLTEIHVENLDNEGSQLLIEELLETKDIPGSIRDLILEKSEGNPYFIESLLRALVNEDILVQKENRWWVQPDLDPGRIPDNLQGLLAARIDRLPPDARFTLRVASVIGRNFPECIIEGVLAQHSPGIELMAQLSILESIGMIRVAQVHPELTYTFQHILLHDAAYNSIVLEDRKALHLHVGNALERKYPDQQQRFAAQLGHHFMEGGENHKALEYYDIAGHVSLDSFANAEAEKFFRLAIQVTEDPDRLAHLYTDTGEALAQQGKHREAIQAWHSAIEFSKGLKKYNRLARIYARSARSAWWGYDAKQSLETCLAGLEAVKGATDSPDIAYLIHETGRAYFFNDKPEKAREYCEHALEIGKKLKAYDVQAEALATIGILPNLSPQEAVTALEKAVQISEANDLFGPAFRAYINLSVVKGNLGEIRQARDYYKRALALENRTSGQLNPNFVEQSIIGASLWLADFPDAKARIDHLHQISSKSNADLSEDTLNQLQLKGIYLRCMGDISAAIETFTDLADRSRQSNQFNNLRRANRRLAEIIIEGHILEDETLMSSDLEMAKGLLLEGFINFGNGNGHQMRTSDHCLLATVFALQGDLDLAQDSIEQAKALYKKQPSMRGQVVVTLAEGRLALAQENFDLAFESLATAVKMYEQMEGRWWRARTWLELAVAYIRRNEPEDIDQAHNILRETLSEFKEMDINHYPDLVIEKLRHVKLISRAQAIAHHKITQELEEAGRVQHTFIPTHPPAIPGFQISGVLLPAHETSGDFFDFIPIENDGLGIVIADVGDKGAGAALYMAISRTLIRTYAGEEQRKPEEVINQVNRRILTDTQRGIFLTMVYGILDPQTSNFEYINAGHNPPCLLHEVDGQIQCTHLEKTGSLVGIFKANKWDTANVKLESGDVLILYTDGITEAQNEVGEFYGTARLQEALQTHYGHPAESFRNKILESVQAFTNTATRLDDITLIVIQKE